MQFASPDVLQSRHDGGEGTDAGDEETIGVVDDVVVGRQMSPRRRRQRTRAQRSGRFPAP